MKNKYLKRGLCILLSLSVLTLSACGSAKKETKADNTSQSQKQASAQVSYDQEAKSASKTETVYVTLNPDGSVAKTTVTDRLHTDETQVYIRDKSDLNNIENMKDDNNPVVQDKDENNLLWNMKDNDLYYSGTTDKALPVEFSIQYTLDGKAIDAKDIAGKSGKVSMVINIQNKSSQQVTVSGQKTLIYTPVIAAGGMILPSDTFRNIKMENGKTISDGTKEIAVFAALPGMKESLQLDKMGLQDLDFDISNTITVTADATDFSMTNMFFAVLPIASLDLLDTSESLSDVKNSLSLLEQLQKNIESMNPSELLSVFTNSTDKIDDFIQLIRDSSKLFADNEALIKLISKYMTEDNLKALQKLLNDINQSDLDRVLEILTDSKVLHFFKTLPSIAEDLKDVMPVLGDLSEDLSDPDVQKALENLPQTIETLSKLKKAISDNEQTIDSLTNILKNLNTQNLSETLNIVEKLMDGNALDKYAKLGDHADQLIDRFNAWINAGKAYKIYSSAPGGMDTKVMFVYETAGIQKEETTTQVQPATDESSTEKGGFIAWIKNLFR